MKKLMLLIVILLICSSSYADRPTDGPPGQEDTNFCDEHPNHPLCGGDEAPIDDYVLSAFAVMVLFMSIYYRRKRD